MTDQDQPTLGTFVADVTQLDDAGNKLLLELPDGRLLIAQRLMPAS